MDFQILRNKSMSQLEIPKLFSKSKINLFKKREGMNFYKKINLRTNYQQIKNQTQKKLGIEKRKFYSENTTICPSFSREKSSYYSPTGIKRIMSMDDFNYYNNIFKQKKLFKPPRKVFNNNLNLLYSENEKDLEEKMKHENKKLIEKGKQIKFTKRLKNTNNVVNEIKKKIIFIKGISDSLFPHIILNRIKKLNNEKEGKTKIFYPPFQLKLNSIKIKDKNIEKYLSNCISVSKYKNFSGNE